MPIKAELRPLYNSLEYRERRKRIVVDRDKQTCKHCQREQGTPYRNGKNKWVAVQVGMAHLDQDPRHDDDDNLATLCRACHLAHDRRFHVVHARETRCIRKDAARPLLAAGEARV